MLSYLSDSAVLKVRPRLLLLYFEIIQEFGRVQKGMPFIQNCFYHAIILGILEIEQILLETHRDQSLPERSDDHFQYAVTNPLFLIHQDFGCQAIQSVRYTLFLLFRQELQISVGWIR